MGQARFRSDRRKPAGINSSMVVILVMIRPTMNSDGVVSTTKVRTLSFVAGSCQLSHSAAIPRESCPSWRSRKVVSPAGPARFIEAVEQFLVRRAIPSPRIVR